jgi:hypothetical protein
MRRWTIKRAALAALLAMLFLVCLILVLPDVDLPDAAFHGGTAPVAVQARSLAAPSPLTVATFAELSFSVQNAGRDSALPVLFTDTSVDSLPILHRSLRC